MPLPITAITNGPYPNRIQIQLGSLQGPFTQDGPLGNFDPSRDLQFYCNGARLIVQTWSFDANNNRYLVFMTTQFDLQGLIQVTHHMPDPPFQFNANPPIFGIQVGTEPDMDAG
jgi:hypothetical protein